MELRNELLNIYEQSGLKEIFDTQGPPFRDEKKKFWKLKFVRRVEAPVSGIELWERKDGNYFRIHYRPTAPVWLPDALKRWANVRNSDEYGTNFNGDPLIPATALAKLLRAFSDGHRQGRRSVAIDIADSRNHWSGLRRPPSNPIMSEGILRFEEFWRRFDCEGSAQQVHPDDSDSLTERDRQQMQLGLLPLPVNGNLRSADLVFLMLNPGFSESDREWGDVFSRRSLVASETANLHQREWASDYPMFDLNPEFVGSGGANYWAGSLGRMKGKLGHLASALAAPDDGDHSSIRRELANRVAVVQLVAYRSTSFADLQGGQSRAGPPQLRLKSSLEALELARALVREGDKLVVIPYGIQHWGYLSPVSSESLVVYKRGLREAHFAPTSAGYRPAIEKLRQRRYGE